MIFGNIILSFAENMQHLLRSERLRIANTFPEVPNMSQLTNPVILVVDPSGLDLTATASLLHSNGYDVHCAQDREAALKAAESVSIDLIICDTAIDQERESSLVDDIRSLPQRNDVPVMYICSNQTSDIIRRTDRVGAAYYLRKPFELEVMLDLVDKAMWMPHLVNTHLNQTVSQPHFISKVQGSNRSSSFSNFPATGK